MKTLSETLDQAMNSFEKMTDEELKNCFEASKNGIVSAAVLDKFSFFRCQEEDNVFTQKFVSNAKISDILKHLIIGNIFDEIEAANDDCFLMAA